MFFLLSQIFVCLLIAALLGALVAWYLRRNMAQRREAAIQQSCKEQLRQVELESDRSIHQQAAEIEKLKKPQLAVDSSTGEEEYDNLVTNLQGQVTEREDAIAELSNEILSLRDELTDALNTAVQLETELLLKVDEQDQQPDQAADEAALAELKEKIRLRDETISALRDELAGKEQRSDDQRRELDKQFRSVMDEAIGWQEKYEAAAAKLAQHKTGVVVLNPVATESTSLLSEPAKGSGDEEKRERAISDRIGSVLSHPGGHKDKLQEIRGIGPVLERKLNDFGIYHFKQIAEFGADDITRVSNELGKFATRIQRDEWVLQAQTLHRKYHDKN